MGKGLSNLWSFRSFFHGEKGGEENEAMYDSTSGSLWQWTLSPVLSKALNCASDILRGFKEFE